MDNNDCYTITTFFAGVKNYWTGFSWTSDRDSASPYWKAEANRIRRKIAKGIVEPLEGNNQSEVGK